MTTKIGFGIAAANGTIGERAIKLILEKFVTGDVISSINTILLHQYSEIINSTLKQHFNMHKLQSLTPRG